MSDHPSFYEQIKRGIGEVKAASADGKWTTAEIFGVAGCLIEVAGHIIALIKNPNEHFDELVRDAERVFDEVFVPIDVPIVPEATERVLETFARGMIRPALQKLLDSVAK